MKKKIKKFFTWLVDSNSSQAKQIRTFIEIGGAYLIQMLPQLFLDYSLPIWLQVVITIIGSMLVTLLFSKLYIKRNVITDAEKTLETIIPKQTINRLKEIAKNK